MLNDCRHDTLDRDTFVCLGPRCTLQFAVKTQFVVKTQFAAKTPANAMCDT